MDGWMDEVAGSAHLVIEDVAVLRAEGMALHRRHNIGG